MGYPFVHYDTSELFFHPLLKPYGSNYKQWYELIRVNLKKNDILYTLEELLGERPGPATSQEYDDDNRRRQDAFIEGDVTITHLMEPGLKEHFKLYETFDIMEELRTGFANELKKIVMIIGTSFSQT